MRASDRYLCTLLIFTVLSAPSLLQAASFTVTNTNNSGAGSLRQAITDANNAAGLDTIVFNISGSPPFTISPTSALPTITSPVIIDGWSQPGWTSAPLIQLNGTNAGAGANGLAISAGGSTVRGLIINRFRGNGIVLQSNGANTIAGCYIGTNSAGTAASANNGYGISINGVASNTIGGTATADRNLISGNGSRGINISGGSSAANVLRGNYIGTNAAGTAVIGNGAEGVVLDGAINTTIGGTATGAGNVIGGSAYEGIWIINGATGTIIQGNFIGTNANGTLDLGNNDSGIGIGNTGSASNNTVGGTVAGAGNVIAFNRRVGVAIDKSATGTAVGNAVLGNSIYSNTGLGIDLDDTYASPSSPGVTPNDTGDADSGGNNRQNFPILVSATVSGGNTTIVGTLNSTASTSFRIEFFSSPTGDPSGYGEGQTFLGFINVTTDGAGNASFTATLTGVSVTAGHIVTATATDSSNNTSEFGPNVVAAVGASAPGGFNAFETSTASGAITGVVKTKAAGSAFSVALVALNPARTGVLTTFTGSVTVELLDTSNNTGALDSTTNCRSSWTSIQTLSPNPSFTTPDNGRINVSFTHGTARRDMRVRVTYTGGGTTVVGCSTDNFAIRPSSFIALQATDANDTSTGATRSLNNSNSASGVVHRAGRAFSVLASAVNADGSTVTPGYDGTPTLSVASCVQPAGCSAGALSSSLTASNGIVAGTATYNEAGVISAILSDSTFANVDLADSSAAERTITSSAATFGRFVPDVYRLTVSTAPQFATPVCGAGPGTQLFTYVGQTFSFGTVPVILSTPLNASGVAIANARPRFGVSHATGTVTASGAPTSFNQTTAAVNVAQGATSLITFDAGSFSFTRGSTPVASFTPSFTMTVNLADTTENGTSGNTTINAQAPLTFSPISFSGGFGDFHYARAQMRPAYGDVRRELYVPLEIQRYNGLGWVRLTQAGSCFSAPASTFAYSSASGLLTNGGGTPNCATRVASTVATSSGQGLALLAKPGNVTTTQASTMIVTLNLKMAAEGSTCNAAPALVPATTNNAPWLAQPDGSNPSVRVTWGRMRGDLLLHERFD